MITITIDGSYYAMVPFFIECDDGVKIEVDEDEYAKYIAALDIVQDFQAKLDVAYYAARGRK